MSFLTNQAIHLLEKEGYRVMSLTDPPDAQEAIDLLRRLGFRVFPPLMVPPVGSLWTATRGVSMGRKVLAVENGHVTYHVIYRVPDNPLLVQHRPKLSSWHRWVQEAQAKQLA